MKIEIIGFKCHIKKEYDFPDGRISLLKGESGVGKTTILQAIYWCLYGNMRGVYNNTGEEKKCSVRITFNGNICKLILGDTGKKKPNELSIYRQKRPELLQVNIEEEIYEDETGQEIINRIFGNKEMWKTCSYIEQKQRCGLLSGSNAERMEFLNQLSFNSQNPQNYINKIHQKLKLVNNEFLKKQSEFTAELNLFKERMKKRKVLSNVRATENEMEKIKKRILKLTDEKKKLNHEVLKQQHLCGKYSTLKQQLSDTENKLKKLKVVEGNIEEYEKLINQNQKKIHNIQHTIRDIENIREFYKEYENVKRKYEKSLENLEKNYPNWKEDEIIVKSEKIWETQRKEEQYRKNFDECQKLGCQYQKEKIHQIIENLQNQKINIDNLKRKARIYSELKSFEKQLLQLNINVDEIKNIDDMDEESRKYLAQLEELKKGQNLYICPNCDKGLYMKGNKLVSTNVKPVTDNEIKNVKNMYIQLYEKIKKLRKASEINIRIQSLKDKCDNEEEIKNFLNNPPNERQISTWITQLSKIEYIEKPKFESKYLKLLFEYQQNQIEFDKYSEKCKNYPDIGKIDASDYQKLCDEEKKLQKRINEANIQISKIKEYKFHVKSYRSLIEKYEKELDLIKLDPGIKDKYNQTCELLENEKKLYDETQYAYEMRKTQIKLEKMRKDVLELNNDLSSIQKLKQNAIKVECRQLQETVNSINIAMTNTLSCFFNEPIHVVLKLYKQLKTKKMVKPGVNISIKYKGSEYDSVNQMSGGEGDRVSLALIMALNSISSSPLLLLDECMTSFDKSLKDECVNVLKMTCEKTIISIDHGGVEGFYDKIIKL